MLASDCVLVKRATDPAKTRMTTVRMAVARLELTFSTPTLARMAVRPAKNAESNAQMNQVMILPLGWTICRMGIVADDGFARYAQMFLFHARRPARKPPRSANSTTA